MTIKCTCGQKDCVNEICFSSEGLHITHNKLPDSVIMYFDANAMVNIIKAARERLNDMGKE